MNSITGNFINQIEANEPFIATKPMVEKWYGYAIGDRDEIKSALEKIGSDLEVNVANRKRVEDEIFRVRNRMLDEALSKGEDAFW